MYKNILFATDLLKEHTSQAEKVANLAKQFHANLYLIHVIELPASIMVAQGLGFTELATPSKEDATTVLSMLGEQLNLPQEQLFVELGSVKEQILKKAKDLNCQLIVLGSHSTSGITFSLGGTANSIVHHAKCDVLTLRE
jgi:nucleotide-binding universal stress UspA family protein